MIAIISPASHCGLGAFPHVQPNQSAFEGENLSSKRLGTSPLRFYRVLGTDKSHDHTKWSNPTLLKVSVAGALADTSGLSYTREAQAHHKLDLKPSKNAIPNTSDTMNQITSPSSVGYWCDEQIQSQANRHSSRDISGARKYSYVAWLRKNELMTTRRNIHGRGY